VEGVKEGGGGGGGGGVSSKTLVQDGNRAYLEAAANIVTDPVLAALACNTFPSIAGDEAAQRACTIRHGCVF